MLSVESTAGSLRPEIRFQQMSLITLELIKTTFSKALLENLDLVVIPVPRMLEEIAIWNLPELRCYLRERISELQVLNFRS